MSRKTRNRTVAYIAAFLVATVTVSCTGPQRRNAILPPERTWVSKIACAHLAYGEGALWCASERHIVKINPKTGRVLAEVSLHHEEARRATSLVAGEGAVWVAFGGGPPRVEKIDPNTNRVVATVRLGRAFGMDTHLSAGEGAVWAAVGDRHVYRINPRTTGVVPIISLDRPVTDVGAGAGAVWAIGEGVVYRIDSSTYKLVATVWAPESLEIAPGRLELSLLGRTMGRRTAVGGGAFWVALLPRRRNGSPVLGRLEPHSHQIIRSIEFESACCPFEDIEASATAIFVLIKTKSAESSIVEINTATSTVTRRIPLGRHGWGDFGYEPRRFAVGEGAIWVWVGGHGLYRIPLSPDG
jgi:hypothetical protein